MSAANHARDWPPSRQYISEAGNAGAAMASPDQTGDDVLAIAEVLAAGLRAGNEAAWRRAYDAAFPVLYRYVLLQTRGDVAQTEEIVQDVWLTAVRRIHRYDPARGSFDAWLHGIADRHCVNARRRYARRQRLLETNANASAPATLRQRVAFDAVDTLAAVWDRLPQTYRRILQSKYVDGQSTADLAERDGRTPKAVEGLLTRARKAFRRAYQEINEHEPDTKKKSEQNDEQQ